MYCPSCGKETPDGSAFCLHCGKSVSAPASSQAITSWEYQDYTLTWNPGETGWVSAEAYSEPSARLYFWQNIQPMVMQELQPLLDEGWQPITEIGPACVQLRYYKSLEGISCAWVIIGALFTWGVSLLFLPFQKSWKFNMTGFQLQLRRPKIMSEAIV